MSLFRDLRRGRMLIEQRLQWAYLAAAATRPQRTAAGSPWVASEMRESRAVGRRP